MRTAILSGIVIGGITFGLPLLGFGSLGVTAGSLAAWFHSTFLGGYIASGSVFAVLQSIGMAGVSAAFKAFVIGSSATASGAYTIYEKLFGNSTT